MSGEDEKNRNMDFVELKIEDGKNRPNLEIEPHETTVSIRFIGNSNPL